MAVPYAPQRFTRFSELHADIRNRIWDFACYIPRVVELHDHYDVTFGVDLLDLEMYDEVEIHSSTRAPAVLEACGESRRRALAIYKPLYEDLAREYIYVKIPRKIYANPAADITLRRRTACRQGDGFMLRTGNDKPAEEKTTHKLGVDTPLAQTRSLAVDYKAALRLSLVATQNHLAQAFLDYGSIDEALHTAYLLMKDEAVSEILKCAASGLEELILVVGNDDDAFDVTLVPFEWAPGQQIGRFRTVMRYADTLRMGLQRLYDKEIEPSYSIPTIKVVTVERKPLESFHLFTKLPYELQDMVWSFACNIPRVIRVEREFTMHRDLNGLEDACRASRSVLNRTMKKFHKSEDQIWNPNSDTIQLPAGCNYKDFAKLGIKSLAVDGIETLKIHEGPFRNGADLKAFKGLEEVILTIGNFEGTCTMQLAELRAEDYRCSLTIPSVRSEAWLVSLVFAEASLLRENLSKVANNWRTYQRRREKKGKKSPDYIVPKVKVAVLIAVNNTVSPYSLGEVDRSEALYLHTRS